MPIDAGKIKRMLPDGSIPDDTLQQAVEDAERLLIHYGVTPDDCDYDLKARLLVAHNLYLWGYSRQVLSKSVGNVSVTFAPIESQVGSGSSPFLQTFFGLLKSSDFIIMP